MVRRMGCGRPVVILLHDRSSLKISPDECPSAKGRLWDSGELLYAASCFSCWVVCRAEQCITDNFASVIENYDLKQ